MLKLGKRTALEMAMADKGTGLDINQLGATLGFGLAIVLALIFAMQAVQTGREQGAREHLRASRDQLAQAFQAAFDKRQKDLALALDNQELRSALVVFDGAAQLRARTEIGKLVATLDDAQFFEPGVPELDSADLGAFGYAKAEQLAEAREAGAPARVQAHACSNATKAHCLAQVQPIKSGDQIIAFAYIKSALPTIPEVAGELSVGLGQLDFMLGSRANSSLRLESAGEGGGELAMMDKPTPIEGSVFSVSALAPNLFKPSVFLAVLDGTGSGTNWLLCLLMIAGAAGLGYTRWRLPGRARDAAPAATAAPNADDLAQKLAKVKDLGEAPKVEVAEAAAAAPAKPAATAGAIERSIFRAYDIRGVVGKTLFPSTAMLIGQAIGSVVREKGLREVVVARDGRLSGPEMVEALAKGLRNAGCDVIDIGAVPTPVLYFATHQLRTGSGVMVTGSHNPPDYNGFKIVVGGETLAEDAIQDLFARIVEGRLAHGSGGLQSMEMLDDYLDRITSDIQISRPLKVVVDAGNGIAGIIAPKVLEGIGCQVMPLHCDVDGRFPNHHPDPGDLHTLEDLKVAIKQFDADLGVAFDGDGDRLGVVTKSGDVIFPDRLLMLFAQDVLTRNPGASIIYDVKCTGQLSEVIVRAGGSPVMWKTGHSLIKAKMKEEESALAGEMSGHFFFQERWYGFDDGIYAAARLLDILGERNESPEQVFAELPNSVSTPELKIQMEEGHHYEFMERFREKAKFPGARVTTIDGVRADYKDGFGLVRCSNTTPCLVLRFEAVNKIGLNRIQDTFRMQLQAVDPKLQLPF